MNKRWVPRRRSSNEVVSVVDNDASLEFVVTREGSRGRKGPEGRLNRR